MINQLTPILLFAFILFTIAISIVFYSLKYGITPTPSTRKAKQAVVDLIPKQIQGNVYELGSGWGTLAFPLASKLPDCPIYAFEMSPIPWFYSILLQKYKQLKNVYFIRKDFFAVPLQDARLIVCYLYPEAMRKLKIKFEMELKEGTYVISNTFAIPGWNPIKVVTLDDIYHTPIYLYRT